MVGINQVTDAGNLKSPTRKTIVEWILNAWDALAMEIIKKSFKTCGLNLATDGSEDCQIHCLKEDQPCHAALELFKSQQSILPEPDVNPFQPTEDDLRDAEPAFKIIETSDEGDIDIEVD